MAIQLGVTTRNARLDAIETVVGTTAHLRIRSGTQPATCGDADTGTLIATLTLPTDWMNAAASGQMTKAGTWSGTASASAVAGYFRLYNSAETVCHMQGTIGQGSGDLSLDNTNIASGQTITINTFTITDGNA